MRSVLPSSWRAQVWGRVLLTLALATGMAAGLAGCSASTTDTTVRGEEGEVVESGDVGVFVVQEGDCVLLGEVAGTETSEVEQFQAVPCEDPHTGEVVLRDDEFFAGSDEFPGEDALFADAAVECVSALEAYTGQAYQDSPYDAVPVVPTETSWNDADDRELLCIGVTLGETPDEFAETTGSIRGE